jgi:hypothetical protein
MSDFNQWSTAVKNVATILKRRFPNLTVEETIDLAGEVVKAVLEAHT